MTDKELLELAAKAAGGFVYVENMGWITQDADGNRGSWWKPLEDDGDTLRLAVKLRMDIYALSNGCEARSGSINHEISEIAKDDDLCAATRRAIVRAAAGVGKKMLSHDEFILMFHGRFDEETVERAAAAIGKAMP